MTDDNMTTSNQKLIAAPPKGEAQPLRVRGHSVGRLEEAGTAPLTSGELQHMSLPTSDGSHPKGLSFLRLRTRQCEKTKVVHMRENNHGRVGVTHTGVLGDGRAEIRPGCGVGATFTGDPSCSPADEPSQEQRVRVDQMRVVQHDHDRTLGCEGEHALAHRGEMIEALGLVDQRVNFRVRSAAGIEGGEHLRPRPVGRGARSRPPGRPGDIHAPGARGRGHLPRKAGFSNAGGARQDQDVSGPDRRGVERFGREREFPTPAYEPVRHSKPCRSHPMTPSGTRGHRVWHALSE